MPIERTPARVPDIGINPSGSTESTGGNSSKTKSWAEALATPGPSASTAGAGFQPRRLHRERERPMPVAQLSAAPQRPPKAMSSGRSQGTGARPVEIRRMDGLARLLHSNLRDERYEEEPGWKKPVVTAVGFAKEEANNETVLVIAHNTTSPAQQEIDVQRLKTLKLAAAGDLSQREAVRDLMRDSAYRGSKAAKRMTKDLDKFVRAYTDNDSESLIPYVENLQNLFAQDEMRVKDATIMKGRGVVHAEAALIHEQVAGPVGVSKLSCADCFDYAETKGRSADLRGTHGLAFPGWRQPDTNQVSDRSRIDPRITQTASDSESE